MYLKYILLTVCLLLAFAIRTTYPQAKTLNRKIEPITISMGSLSGFAGSNFEAAPTSEIFVFAFSSASQSWNMIPFQIDERDASGSYFSADETSGLDENDELTFLAEDTGDKADGWVDNLDSQQYSRLEVKVTEPLSPGEIGWVYLYRSSTLSVEFEPYLQYIPAPQGTPADTVVGVTYKIGAGGDEAGQSSGFFDFLSFPQAPNLDILDRQKVRVDVSVFIDLNLTEENFEFRQMRQLVGPVRIIKELDLNIIEDVITLPFEFYPYSLVLGGTFTIPDTLPIAPNARITRLSQTFDFAPAAMGMEFFSNHNSTAITIDGSMHPDSTVFDARLDTLPDINWLHVSGSQGTLVNLLKISAIGDQRVLKYLDNNSTDNNDTGDKMHYGEAGMEVTGNRIVGDFPLGLKSFFLEPNQPSIIGEQLAFFEKNPLQVESELQDFSAVSVESDDESGLPKTFALAQNFPNPFNPETLIRYQIAGANLSPLKTTLKIYDLLGREVRDLVDEQQAPGVYEVKWDGTNDAGQRISSGVYIYQLKSGDFIQSRKLILIK